ncbi:peptide-binding protein, partial [Burkholderia contaminans]
PQAAPGGSPPVHDARPSAARGGWNGAIRTPPPSAPAPAAIPGAAVNPRPAAPPPAAVMRPSPAPGGEGRSMPVPVHPGGGGGGYGGARPQGGGNGGGSHGGGGGGGSGGGPEDFRH